ncbi:MAG: prephenate dehydrogenase/arogenate dehydrogenase family protein [Clostridia bacterium]|nr:prephenate dehydrogenase/arogenate dehydrogenase family protein [Clostridia bacterium]
MYKIGIIGLGFMGGCIAKSLIKSEKIEEICAFDTNKESMQKAFEEGTITKIAKEIKDFRDSDIIFICTPVGLISQFAEKLKNIVKSECIITDIGSTKRTILDSIKKIDINFIGGHPMVGSERTGYDTSNDYLFENAYYILIKNNNNTNIEKMQEIIGELKAIPVLLDAKNHDYVMAAISHVPHVIASALVNLVQELDNSDQKMKLLAAGGFKDITRIASADPTMWEHICIENESEMVKVLEKYINNLNYIKEKIGSKNYMYNFFKTSKEYRDSFAIKKVNGQTNPTINVSIKDEKGSIASVATLLAKNNINIKNIGIENNRENMNGALYIVFENYKEKEKGFEILQENNYEVKSIR